MNSGRIGTFSGIRLGFAANARFTGNTLLQNSGDGLELDAIAVIAPLSRNNAINNGDCGVSSNTLGSFPLSAFYIDGNPGGSTCALTFTTVKPEPAVPGPVRVNRARRVVGG